MNIHFHYDRLKHLQDLSNFEIKLKELPNQQNSNHSTSIVSRVSLSVSDMATGQATIRLPCPVHPCNIVLLSFDKKVVSKGMTKYVKNTRRIKTNSIFTPIYLFLNNIKLNLWTRLGFCQNRPDLPPGRLGHPKPKIPNNNVSNVNNLKTVIHSAL